MLTDTVSDMLTRIRNGQTAKLAYVEMYSSKMILSILEVLTKEGYIISYEIDENDNKPIVKVHLKYIEGKPVIREIKRISKPGRRKYTGIKKCNKSYNGLGIKILSTSKGVMSDHQARKLNVGGEEICTVY
ncbi:MAG: 30S ribosomal protein S8 [Sphingobacteriia bacterium]|nr:30S ribosomal protein S8 [Sphingobacteriia bacterium]